MNKLTLDQRLFTRKALIQLRFATAKVRGANATQDDGEMFINALENILDTLAIACGVFDESEG